MVVRIITADVVAGLRQLPDESVHCVVTSPPYWGLRDYGVVGQIGLEDSPEDFIDKMVGVFAEVRRVLRPDGTLWLNLGDSYVPENRGENAKPRKEYPAGMQAIHMHADLPTRKSQILAVRASGLKRKDLVGMPWRVAFGLQADGWWLRSDIVWSKPNPMPESITDRPTKSHEYVFLLAKGERYYYDNDAIREPYSKNSLGRYAYALQGTAPTCRQEGGDVSRRDREKGVHEPNPLGRNKRSVWEITTAPFSEAHFATFPPELPEVCIKAGCPVGGTVLDPFAGAGTTCLVADRLQRNAIGIELNPEYAAIAERRINRDRGGLLDLMEAAD